MRKAIIPIMLSIAMAIGVILGVGLTGGNHSGSQRLEWKKIDQILQYVEHDYVDTVSRKTLEDEVIAFLLQRLDPHSHYITEEDLTEVNEPLEGGFEGVGIQFNLNSDTIYVVKTIKGGPSEQAGMMAGDKIIAVNGDTLAGSGLISRDVMKLLKGPSGSDVIVSVLRGEKIFDVSITRGEIPLASIEAAYLLNDSTIYVRLARFAKNTYDEFQEQVYPLQTSSVKHFIFDLRGNGGGFLDAAIDLSDEFLGEDKLITYTEGKSRPRSEYFATDNGRFEDTKLYLIIDGYSASASEIMAGAMQDHGRAIIYGKRSFGKGLVQEQSEWADGSATRLTVARYYTPNGRSIQRPYQSFQSDIDYYGVLDDTAAQGGIVPDVEIKRDTSGITWLYAELVHRGLITDFAYQFRDGELQNLQALSFAEFNSTLQDTFLLEGLRHYLVARDVEIDSAEWSRSSEKMAIRIKSIIARSLFDEEGYFKVVNPNDEAVKRILEDIKKPKPWTSVL